MASEPEARVADVGAELENFERLSIGDDLLDLLSL
jgi:hypothetical protein